MLATDYHDYVADNAENKDEDGAPDGKDSVGAEDGEQGGGERGGRVGDDPTNQPGQACIGCRTWSVVRPMLIMFLTKSCSPAVVKSR